MADRLPFEYADWCSGPVVDLDLLPTGFPICTIPTFTSPTFRTKDNPALTIPDVLPPPFCPCVPTMSPGLDVVFNIRNAYATYPLNSGGDPTSVGVTVLVPPRFHLEVDPVTADCCDPEFEVDYNIDLPCIPFTLSARNNVRTGLSGGLSVTKDALACEYILDLDLTGTELCLGPAETDVIIDYEMECEPEEITTWECSLSLEDDPVTGQTCIWMYNDVHFAIPLLARLANSGDAPIQITKNTVVT